MALRDIAADEELTFDYAMTDDEPYEMECNCTPMPAGHNRARLDCSADSYFSWFIQKSNEPSSVTCKRSPRAGRWVYTGRGS